MTDATLVLGKAGAQSNTATVYPELWLKPALDDLGNPIANSYVLCVRDDATIEALATVQANQSAILAELTAIKNLLAGGIDVNVISGGL